MLKPIAVVGGDAALVERLQAHLRQPDAHLFAHTPGAPVPHGTLGVVGAGEGALPALGAALEAAAGYESALLLMAEAIEAREGHKPGSARRLIEHIGRFAAAMGLSPQERSQFERAAMLRGIGKLRIDNDTLLKKSVLGYDEWLLIQRHPTLGADMLREMGYCTDVCGIVQAHHECYDGTGYPEKLERDAIPRLARALKIADVYCAMTSPRHYRRGHASHAEALEHFKTERGKHFDPNLIDLFVDGQVGQPWPGDE